MYEIKKAKGGYIVYLKAKNGEILMTSEIVKTKQSAIQNRNSSIFNSLSWAIEKANEVSDWEYERFYLKGKTDDITLFPHYEFKTIPRKIETKPKSSKKPKITKPKTTKPKTKKKSI